MATVTPKLTPVSLTRRPVTRLIQLIVGLTLYGVSMAFMIRAGLGLDPWDVLHQGLANHVPLSFGTITALVGALVLLVWWPLRQRPGIGTVANILVIAVAVDGALAVLPAATNLWWQVPLMVLGVVLNGVATACYVGARLGPGPRDGLMTGLHARTGKSVRLVRTCIEVVVLATGWLLGGTVGVGTVLYALSIGPLTQFFLPWLAYRDGAAATTPPPAG